MLPFIDEITALDYHSDQAWAWFIGLNIVFAVAWKVVAPRLRAIIKAWLRWDEEFWRRFAEYFGALAGPSIIQRNLIPELSIIIYTIVAADLYWLLKSPVIPAIFGLISFDCLILWKGEALVRWVESKIFRPKPHELTPEERAELSPAEFKPPT